MAVEFVFMFLVSGLTLTDEVVVYTGEGYARPDNINYLQDNYTDTCTMFEADVQLQTPQDTILRVVVLDENANYVNVSVIGENFTCGWDLFVIPLTALQTKDWTGIWLTCDLMQTSNKTGSETCTFNCQCRGGCAEIQVCRRPRKPDQSSWSLCHLHISFPTTERIIVNGCDDVSVTRRGIYRLRTKILGHMKDVYCDVDDKGNKWTVVLRRKDGSENFVREWDAYKVGFGSLTGEFWAGNELMHKLTSDGRTYYLRVDLESYDGTAVFALYKNFSVGPEEDNYRLYVSGYVPDSTAGDSLSRHNKMSFSTKNHDNDLYKWNCADKYGAPWWFEKCHDAFLTGEYAENLTYARGITWHSKWGYYTFARYASMMIRPNQ